MQKYNKRIFAVFFWPGVIVSYTSIKTTVFTQLSQNRMYVIQESPAIADKPARRESLPKIAPIRRAYNVVADDTGLSSCV